MKGYFVPLLQKAALCVFLVSLFGMSVSAQNMFRKVSDFDGDGKADYAVTRSSGGQKQWWIWQSSAGLKVVQFGLSSDVNAASDYDGDGKADVAVWRSPITNFNSTTYYILESQTNAFRYYSFFNFIASSPMHQDYNGDGKTDPGVTTGETNVALSVIYSGSSTGFNVSLPPNQIFGLRIGDIDGDGRADRASYDSLNGNNVTITNLVTNETRNVRFGLSNDQYQMADFDGDAKGDLTVYRPSDNTWWWIASSDSTVHVVGWGTSGDTPVPADYDGDGKTDIAVYRPGAQSYYWILGSQSGVSIFPWGTTNDSVVRY